MPYLGRYKAPKAFVHTSSQAMTCLLQINGFSFWPIIYTYHLFPILWFVFSPPGYCHGHSLLTTSVSAASKIYLPPNWIWYCSNHDARKMAMSLTSSVCPTHNARIEAWTWMFGFAKCFKCDATKDFTLLDQYKPSNLLELTSLPD